MSAKSALAITLLNANATFSISYESWDSANSNGIDLITLRLKLLVMITTCSQYTAPEAVVQQLTQ